MQKVNEQHHGDNIQLGLVISYFGSSVAVEDHHGQIFQCHLRRNQPLPVVGDQVQWQLGHDQTGIIIAIEPRKSLLARGDGKGKMKPLAANVDLLCIVMAPPPVFSDYLIDRYLIAAELLAIAPLLILNKSDLLDEQTRHLMLAQYAPYEKIGYPVIISSAITQEGLGDLQAKLQSKTAVLVGPSGVGKSSIINMLNQGQDIRVNEVSGKGIGKHTTTATRLYHLKQGGQLIDSPGVREFNLWPVNAQDILRGFKEINALNGCRFRDCQHQAEPECAVQAAVVSGKISAQRVANYQAEMKRQKIENREYRK